ncbi:MAG: preprotein translocase subunit SecE [Gammaproteobacteria bacterium]|jgi:preprotein translocase subunit SecE|nr:preprotein translocase subunit SecE [Gammaproteobacteria bacterium]
MNNKPTAQSTFAERLKWIVVVVLLITGIVANYYLAQLTLPVRLGGWLLLVAVAAGISATTVKGKQALAFARDSQLELRKVVWPTRQETMQTTLIVVVIVAIAAVILWLLDSILLWAISLIT